jgi:hypothetical protein
VEGHRPSLERIGPGDIESLGIRRGVGARDETFAAAERMGPVVGVKRRRSSDDGHIGFAAGVSRSGERHGDRVLPGFVDDE